MLKNIIENTHLVKLNERLITLFNLPKYNNVVILVGGSGSGKGYILNNVLGIDGKIIDVDNLKIKLIKLKSLKDKIKKDYGIGIDKLDMKNPEDTRLFHQIVKDLKLKDKMLKNLFKSIVNTNYKPNLIFDITGKDLEDIIEISQFTQNVGYKKENIHIVWVLNDFEISKIQNKERPRQVPDDILLATHKGVALVMGTILKKEINIRKYVDGYIYVVFNNREKDIISMRNVQIDNSLLRKLLNQDVDLIKSNIFVIKEPGQNIETLNKDLINKIKNYIPKEIKNLL